MYPHIFSFIFKRYRSLGWQYYFQHFEHVSPLLLTSMVSDVKSTVNLVEDILCMMSFLLCFHVSLLLLGFWQFDCDVSRWMSRLMLFIKSRKIFFPIYLFKYSFYLSLSSPSRIPIMIYINTFDFVLQMSEVLVIHFSFWFLEWKISIDLSLSSLILSPANLNLLLILSSKFFISVVLFNSRISILILFNISISLLLLSIWWEIILILLFSSLDIVYFLSICIIIDLKSLASISSIWGFLTYCFYWPLFPPVYVPYIPGWLV